MMSTGSTGSLFNIGSPEPRPLSAERVREFTGRCSVGFLDRPALTVSYLIAVCVAYFPAQGTESSGGGLTDRLKLIEKFSRRLIGRLERSPKWSHSHAIF